MSETRMSANSIRECKPCSCWNDSYYSDAVLLVDMQRCCRHWMTLLGTWLVLYISAACWTTLSLYSQLTMEDRPMDLTSTMPVTGHSGVWFSVCALQFYSTGCIQCAKHEATLWYLFICLCPMYFSDRKWKWVICAHVPQHGWHMFQLF